MRKTLRKTILMITIVTLACVSCMGMTGCANIFREIAIVEDPMYSPLIRTLEDPSLFGMPPIVPDDQVNDGCSIMPEAASQTPTLGRGDGTLR